MSNPLEFKEELEKLINRHSMENGSDTPDYILCEFLTASIRAFDTATKGRDWWYREDEGEISRLKADLAVAREALAKRDLFIEEAGEQQEYKKWEKALGEKL